MGSDEDSKGRTEQFAYLDLLATTLAEHEKNLDELINRLEKISDGLSKIVRTMKSEEPPTARRIDKEEMPETLIYMKLKLGRPSEQLKMILDSLKE